MWEGHCQVFLKFHLNSVVMWEGHCQVFLKFHLNSVVMWYWLVDDDDVT